MGVGNNIYLMSALLGADPSAVKPAIATTTASSLPKFTDVKLSDFKTGESSRDFRLGQPSDKPTMLMISTDHCPACVQLQRAVEEAKIVDPKSATGLDYKILKLDPEKDSKLIEQLGVEGFPKTVFMKPNGDLIHYKDNSIPSADGNGKEARQELANLSDKIVEAYKPKEEAK